MFLVFMLFTILEIFAWFGIIPDLSFVQQLFMGIGWILSLIFAFLDSPVYVPNDLKPDDLKDMDFSDIGGTD